MNAKMTVTQRMIHKMLLSPQMRMSINILGMSSADLVEYIDSVLEKNPFLQKIYDTKKNRNQLTGSYLSPDTQDTIQSDDDPRAVLLSQLKMLHLENELMEIASYLIYEMDESGYIKCDIIGAAHELMAEPETVEEVLDAIQNLDPPGIGARDLKECLQIQLRRQGRENSLAFIIVTENLAELATNDVVAISAMLNEDESDVRKAIEEIKLLNPRPASTLLAKSAAVVYPDLVASFKDSKARIEINREYLPTLKLYNPYETELNIIKDPEAKKFMQENQELARYFIDGLKRREDTLCKVAQFILDYQAGHFTSGRPLRTIAIKDVAEALKMHQSTISRTVTNKYIFIDGKVVPLKSLLSHGMKTTNGEVVSKSYVKTRIKDLITREDKKNPISDDKIQKALEHEGFDIKRRTVAKYREELKLLPSHLRRKKS